jgi:hypothetical protein
MLMHSPSPTKPPPGHGKSVGSHAYSRDGHRWTVSNTNPYTSLVNFSNGTSFDMRRRERPQLLLSGRGQPRYFSTGVEDYGDHTWTLVMKFYSAAAQDDAPVKTDDQWQGLQHMSDDQPAPPSRRRPPPFDYPGAGFRAGLPASVPGLGYPSMDLLDGYPTWSLNRSTVAYFLGNDTGLNNAEEMAAEARFGVVGLRWQLSMRDSNWSHLERWEAETVVAIKAINPDTQVLVSRNVQVGGVFWDSMRPFFLDDELARASNLWLVGQRGGTVTPGQPRCGAGVLCNGSWGCPNCGPDASIPYGQLRFNWSSPVLRAWWLHTHMVSAADRPNISGVHMDCECGENPGLAPAQHNSFDNDALAGFLAHLPVFRAKRKMSIAWHAEHVQQRSCDTDMESLEHYANDTSQTLQLGWDNRPSTFNQTLAAVLILRGPSAHARL